jgi:hypothetical protein
MTTVYSAKTLLLFLEIRQSSSLYPSLVTSQTLTPQYPSVSTICPRYMQLSLVGDLRTVKHGFKFGEKTSSTLETIQSATSVLKVYVLSFIAAPI